MKVIIPVAGIGTRLRPHTFSLPKPLLHVAGKPIIAHLLDPVGQLDPDEVIFVVGYKGVQIREYVTGRYSFKSSFVQQDKLLGLGYALGLALDSVADGEVLIMLGDTIVECDLRRFIAAGDYVLGVRHVDDPHRFGIVEVENNRIVRVEEKPEHPKTNLAVIGLYYFREAGPLKAALHNHLESGQTTKGEMQFTDALQMMITGGTHFVPYEVQEWYDCGKKETMLETNRHILEEMDQAPSIDGSVIVPPVFISPTAQVINSVVGPYVSVSEGAVVSRSIIRNSIIGSHATVENVSLEDSIVGHHAVIRGGSRILSIGDSSVIDPI